MSGQGDTAHLAAALAACPLEHALSRGSGAYAHRMLRGEIARAAHCRCRAVLALPPSRCTVTGDAAIIPLSTARAARVFML